MSKDKSLARATQAVLYCLSLLWRGWNKVYGERLGLN